MISIIIPLYNAQDYIKQTIESCINQSYTDIEIIVIDDCSDDMSASIVHELETKDPRIQYYCNQNNMGVIKTINAGLYHCSGDYIVVLGNDDLLDKRHLEIVTEKIEEREYSFIYFSSNLIDEKGDVFDVRLFDDIEGKYSLFARKNPINACGTVINAKYLRKLGGYPEKLGYKNCGEWYLWIELLKFERCLYVQDVRSYYRIHSKNLTKKLYSRENIRSTKDYSLLCMKKALSLKEITIVEKIYYTFFRFLYNLKMNIKLLIA